MEPLLTFSGVELYYDQVYALRNVSLEVNEGETVALIGANGAGKTSILRAITGLRKIRSGEIRFRGQRIDGHPPDELVKMGIAMVPEGRRSFPLMSVKDNLLMGAFTRHDKAEVARTLEAVLARFPRLRERYGQAAGTMSGGEQQMLAIGRGLMAKPKLLLLDEPSWGIAPKFVTKVLDTIQLVNQQGVSVLLVEQNLHKALAIAHYGYVIQTGRIVIEGSGQELLDNEDVRKAYLGV
jgi:branched-chain amino acid transport system ATP-binding protein